MTTIAVGITAGSMDSPLIRTDANAADPKGNISCISVQAAKQKKEVYLCLKTSTFIEVQLNLPYGGTDDMGTSVFSVVGFSTRTDK